MIKIDHDEFIRNWQVTPHNNMNLLLGAGASVSSGIPTGWLLSWEFKKRIFCSQNKHISDTKFKDLESPHVQQELQNYFDSQNNFPKLGSAEEYSFYFEKCFTTQQHRQLFIQDLIKDQKPSLGYLCIGSLIDSGIIKHIWSTNFDDLVEKAVAKVNHTLSFAVYSPETSQQYKNFSANLPCVLKLHGDYRYDYLRNTLEETNKLEELLRKEFISEHQKNGLIIIGYAGNDESIRSVIADTLQEQKPFPLGLIWCIRPGEVPKNEIQEFVKLANEKNGCSGFLQIDNFDEFIYDLYSSKKLSIPDIEKIADTLFQKRQPFNAKQATSTFHPVKLNALKISSLPKSIYCATTKLKTWKELNEFTKDKNFYAAPYKGKTYFIGELNTIKKGCNGILEDDIKIEDVQEKWLYHETSFFLSLLYDLIHNVFTKQLNFSCSIYSNGLKRYYSKKKPIPSMSKLFSVYEAIEIQLNWVNESLWLNLTPTVEAIPINSNNNRFEKQKIINQLTSKRYNIPYNEAYRFWIDEIKSIGKNCLFNYFGFEIEVNLNSAFAGEKFSESVPTFEGAFVIEEPKLIFSINEKQYKSIHPLKGLKNYAPLDYSFSMNGEISPTLKLALISPDYKFSNLINHLQRLKNQISIQSEKEYLIEYSGFDAIYKKYIDIPNDTKSNLVSLIRKEDIDQINPLQFYDLLKRKIDHFDSFKGDFNILMIYIPDDWKRFRESKTESVFFDLHDSIKLYCAKKLIKVQFIEDKSIGYFDQSKVQWWLSLGLYAKANGIPWMLDVPQSDTAFIGLGFAIKRTNSTNKVVLGCSHIFDSSGQGLRFLLQPLNNPVLRGKNPFMSKEDARRIMLKLRESYNKLDPNSKLDKVVIHKTTHFTRDEMEGIAQALEGVSQIELLQIQQWTGWRGIQGKFNNGGREIDNYPVKRGTVIQFDKFSFLIWTHGNLNHPELNSQNYYQGKRGIPSPLLVKRFRGYDTIEKTANDILCLTKMNWNGGELYKKLPVTLEFSKRLSQMSKQNEELNNTPYDFRFFI